jgi:hypothetical protein
MQNAASGLLGGAHMIRNDSFLQRGGGSLQYLLRFVKRLMLRHVDACMFTRAV